MATLKNLVDETTKIKNELKTCHTNLKNNLSAKGISVLSTDKMSSLVSKVGSIEVLNNAIKNQKISYKISEKALNLSTDYNGLRSTYFEIKGNYLYLILEDTVSSSDSTSYKTRMFKYDLSTGKVVKQIALNEPASSSMLYDVCFLEDSVLILMEYKGVMQYSLNDFSLIKILTYSIGYNGVPKTLRIGDFLYILNGGSSLSYGKNSMVDKIDLKTMEVVKSYTFSSYSGNYDYKMYTPRFIVSNESNNYIYACAGYGMMGMNRIVKLDLDLNVIETSKDNLEAYEYTAIKGNMLITVNSSGNVRSYNLSSSYSLVGSYNIRSMDGKSVVTSELRACGAIDSSRNYIYLKMGGYVLRINTSNYTQYEEILLPYEAYMFKVVGDTISYCTPKKYAQYAIKSIL